VPAEHLAQTREVHLQRLAARLRRSLLPEGVDQAVGGDDLVRVQEQDREQRPLLGAADVHLPPVLDDLERAENPELHRASTARLGDLTSR
jgi:hypothetical protein